MSFDLALADVRPLPGIAADPERWEQLSRRMHRRVFLRSEGTMVQVGPPQVVSGQLLERSRQVVDRLNRFYAGVAAAYFTRPELRDELLVNPLIEPLLEIEADQPVATPLSRLDAVLSADGKMRVIEINSNGICLFHLRSLLYLIRELARGGFESDARRLDELARSAVVDGFLRFASARLGRPLEGATIGSLAPSGFHRAAQTLNRAAFQRAGCTYVYGGPKHLEITDRDVRMRGTRVDVLWVDYHMYLAYQCARYVETKWPSKMPDYGTTPDEAAALIADPRFLSHLRERRVAMISPARSYLALSKALLSWIWRTDRPVAESDRAFLAEHVARTYSARDRLDGMIALDRIASNRGDYLLKPCQYGGSHGVMIGRLVEQGAWQERLSLIWDDPTWAVQEFHDPVKTSAGDYVSLGLQNFDGRLGGIHIRTAKSLLISARDAGFTAAVLD